MLAGDPSHGDRDHGDVDRSTSAGRSKHPVFLRLPAVIAVALGLALVVALGIAGVTTRGKGAAAPAGPSANSSPATGPVPLVPVDAPLANSPVCAHLIAVLPAALHSGADTLHRRPVAAPAPPAVAAWGNGDPVVLRCGVAQPPEFTATSELLGVDGVQWFKIDSAVPGTNTSSWYAVDRQVCVALTLPGVLGSGPIQQVSSAIAATMPATPLHPAGG